MQQVFRDKTELMRYDRPNLKFCNAPQAQTHQSILHFYMPAADCLVDVTEWVVITVCMSCILNVTSHAAKSADVESHIKNQCVATARMRHHYSKTNDNDASREHTPRSQCRNAAPALRCRCYGNGCVWSPFSNNNVIGLPHVISSPSMFDMCLVS